MCKIHTMHAIFKYCNLNHQLMLDPVAKELTFLSLPHIAISIEICYMQINQQMQKPLHFCDNTIACKKLM